MALRIHLAGPVRVEVDGVAVDDTGLGSLGRLTLAFLVSERHRPVPNDELAEALWGEELPPTWRTALRAARTGVVGRADGARAAADVALEVVSRPFLVGARGDWVERRQAELVEVRLRALEASAEAHTLAGDRTRGVARAEEAVALDPWRESAHVRL
ncbi:MAG: bacterial transcriptional activator domain-containing protein, partial [Actinomycetota bacterium]|nr:bacterial transcriptional activator domain-containing protein [Actinomycetota bacterium]